MDVPSKLIYRAGLPTGRNPDIPFYYSMFRGKCKRKKQGKGRTAEGFGTGGILTFPAWPLPPGSFCGCAPDGYFPENVNFNFVERLREYL